ncbi:unnamed protein product [Dicrocoelium dendriticum]|nr:unnamed protein product [Dicrocoelium dendriticum]
MLLIFIYLRIPYRIFLLSRSYAAHCTDTERWYNTKYLRVDIPDSNLQAWREVECDKEMTLPTPNKYIATEFTVHPRPKDFSNVAPELLVSTDLSRLWFFPDNQFSPSEGFYHIPLYQVSGHSLYSLHACLMSFTC